MPTAGTQIPERLNLARKFRVYRLMKKGTLNERCAEKMLYRLKLLAFCIRPF